MALAACSSAAPSPSAIVATQPGATPASRADPAGLAKLALTPEDMTGLFPNTTYNVEQFFNQPDHYGARVTYPTRIVPHTTALAEGFYSEIEVYDQPKDAGVAFENRVAGLSGQVITLTAADRSVAHRSRAMSSEGFEIGTNQFTVILRKGRTIASIVIRTHNEVSEKQLENLAEVLAARIEQADLGT